MPDSPRNEILLTGPDGNLSAVNDERITAFDDHHVFVEVVHVGGGVRRLTACLKCHLAAIYAVEDVSFDTPGCLAA